MQSVQRTQNELSPNLKVRKDILDFEAMLSQVPGAKFGDSDLCPLKHTFAEGIYVREIFIPKNTALTGKIHKHAHPNFLMKGEVMVVTEGAGREVLKAPRSMISLAGTKRAIYTITDTIWITVHHNPENTTDLKKLEKLVIAKDYFEYEKFRLEGKSQKVLSNPSTNCGLEALKKMSSIKSASMRTLIDMAEDNGVKLYPYAIVDGEQLMTIPFPAIVHSENHFDYISKKEDFDFNKEYTGYVLLTQEADYKKIKISELKNIKGETWVNVGVAAAGVVMNGVKLGLESATDCGKECRAICRTKTSTFFGSRQECKDRCKVECLKRLTPAEQALEQKAYDRRMKEATTIYVVAAIVFAIALGIALYYVFKKK